VRLASSPMVAMLRALEGLSAANRQLEIGDGLGGQLGRNVSGDNRRFAEGAAAGGATRLVFGGLTEAQALGGQERLDLVEGGLAEVLVGEELGLAGAEKVAQASDVHFLEAVAAADGELEVGDGMFSTASRRSPRRSASSS